ncbi:MAG: hypothetical protein DRP33_06230 [Thermotogae bacterium]|nr:MAG: hypothetical protein DRP33_06230 [Thermotogota bacterium]
MKKVQLFLFISIVIAISTFSITEFIPENYDAVYLAHNVSEHYVQSKSVGIVSLLADSLGLEPMIQGIIASSFSEYGITTEQLGSIFEGDILTVLSGTDITVVLGPSPETSKLGDILKDAFGEDLYTRNISDYLLISTSQEAIEQCVAGGGTIPSDLFDEFQDPNVCSVMYAPPIDRDGIVISQTGIVSIVDDELVGEIRFVAHNDKSKELLRSLMPNSRYALYKDPNLGGEIFVFVNTSDLSSVGKLIENFILSEENLDIPFLSEIMTEIDVEQPSREEIEKITATAEKFTGQLALSLKISETLGSLLGSLISEEAEEAEVISPTVYAVAQADISLEELGNLIGSQDYQTIAGSEYLVEEGLFITTENGQIKVLSQNPQEYAVEQGSLQKALEYYQPSMPIFVFADITPLINTILGDMGVESHFILTSDISDEAVRIYWSLK